MASTYPGDFQSGGFGDEMIQFIEFAKLRGCRTPSSLAMLLHTEHLQSTFPNVEIAIHMYITIMLSNCSGERSFSKMALIKKQMAQRHV